MATVATVKILMILFCSMLIWLAKMVWILSKILSCETLNSTKEFKSFKTIVRFCFISLSILSLLAKKS